MPKEIFSESRWSRIGLHWGDRSTQISVKWEDVEVFANLSVKDIDRLRKALLRAKRARNKDYLSS
jgi:hypothetical protein